MSATTPNVYGVDDLQMPSPMELHTHTCGSAFKEAKGDGLVQAMEGAEGMAAAILL